MISKNEIRNSGILDFTVFPVDENVEREGYGKNNKKLLIAIADDNDPEINNFLEKVMGSVGIELNADAFVVFLTHGKRFSLSQLSSKIDIEKAIFFGIEPARAGLNLNVTPYKPLHFNKKTYLFADQLSKVQQNAQLKRPLWESLKALFA